MGGNEYYACHRADIDCEYRCCRNCFKGIAKMMVPGVHCNKAHLLEVVNPTPKEEGSPDRPTCVCHLCGGSIESKNKYYSGRDR